MFHYHHGTMSDQEGRPISGDYVTAADYHNAQQKTFEEIHLKVTVVRKFVVHTMSPSDAKAAESTLYIEESSPVMMKLGEREILHMHPSSDRNTTSFTNPEIKINMHLCKIIPLTESIGLRFCSTYTNSDQNRVDKATIISELVPLVQHDRSNASKPSSVPYCGKPDDKCETNAVFLSERMQTVDEMIVNKCTTSPDSNTDSKKQSTSNNKQCFQSADLSFVSPLTNINILQSSTSRNNMNISSEWPLDGEKGINRDDKMRVAERDSNIADYEEREIITQESRDKEQGDGETDAVEAGGLEHNATEFHSGEVVSNTDNFTKDVLTPLVARQLCSETCEHKTTCECKICKLSLKGLPTQQESSNNIHTGCDKVFPTKSLLRIHRSGHNESSINNDSCNCFCGQTFVSDKCEICKTSTKNTKDQNMELFCKKCKNEFKSMRLFKNHKCTNRGNSKTYACRLCGSVFKTCSGLVRHRREKCYPFFCSICNVNCKDKESLKRHLTTHTGSMAKGQIYNCLKCSRNFFTAIGFKKHQKYSCTEHRSYHVNEPWTCPKCKNSYTSQSTIYRHKFKGCHGEKIYKCDTCKKGFYTIEAVKEHVVIHTNVNDQGRYYCSACNKSYSQRSGYLKHKRKGLCDINNVFRCSYCTKVFMNESRRNWHQRMHSASENQQTHVCSKCGKEYFSATALHKHTQRKTCKKLPTFSGRKSDQKVVCDECGKVYGSTSALFKHKQNHRGYRPYVCKLCNKSFCRPFILAQHVKIHTGDRQWLCSRCGKSFYTKSHLKRHQISHDKTQDNVCDICDKRYAYKHDLSKHKKMTHSNVMKESVNLFHPDRMAEVVSRSMNIQDELLTSSDFM